MMIVNDKERLQLEEELLMTCSKAQAINKYIDELEESSKLSELWCKSQQENARLKDKIEKTKQFYTRELLKRQNLQTPMKMSWESVEMFNILDGNK